MLVNITSSICFLIILTILLIDFLSKKKIKKIENTFFKILSTTVFIGLILELSVYSLLLIGINYNSALEVVLEKLLMLYYVVFMYLYILYVFISCHNIIDLSDKKFLNFFRIESVFYAAFFLLLVILPCSFKSQNGFIYPTGICADFSYFIGGIGIFLIFVFCVANYKKIGKRKLIPLLGCIVLAIISIWLQLEYKDLLLLIPSHAILIILLYFTIENPDLKMIEELELAKNQADQANNAKTDFLSSMSHEIRTPLNAIVGFSECIKQSDDINEVHQDADDVIKASQTLLEIVNGILDISKIESGKLEIVNSNYKAKEIFNDVARLITPKMSEKALDFQVSIAPDIPENLYGDYNNVKKVVTNLLSNAVKYTDDGYVKYEVRCINNKNVSRLVISVEDSGRGIKQENIDKLFTKFQRLDEDKNTTLEGTGLGLAITKQLVELMGGKVIVQSVYGSGSKFTIILDQRIEYVEEVVSNNVTLESNSKIDISGKKILIVDDNVLNIKVASKLLAKYNLNIDTSESGMDAIEKIRNGNVYDLILLDDMMPKMSGVETFKQLKNDYNINIPIVALTANAISGMKEKYIDIGFDDYLAKPINRDELNEIICRYLGTKNKTDKIDFGELPKDFYEIGDEETIAKPEDNKQ